MANQQSLINRQPNSQTTGPSVPSTADRLLLGVVDGGMGAIIFAAPYFMGGRHPLGQLVVVLLAVVVAVAWMVRGFVARANRWRSCPLQWLIAAAVALMLLQITALPQGVLKAISPTAAETISLGQSAGGSLIGLGSWSTVSMTPSETRGAIVMFVSYGLLLLVAVQRIRSIRDVERLLRFLAIATALMASFALIQYVTSNGKFFWFYEHPFRHNRWSVQGMFINPNHFAHLMALGVGPLIWWIHQAAITETSGRRAAGQFGGAGFSGGAGFFGGGRSLAVILRVLMLAIVLFASAMSHSRGGIAIVLLAAAICTGLYFRSKLFGPRAMFAIAGLSLLVAASLVIHGYQSVSRQLDDIISGKLADLDEGGMRGSVFAATATAAGEHFVLGTGVGSFRDVHPSYLDRHFETEFTYAESGYLQIAMEAGLPGITLLLICIVLCTRWAARTLRDRKQSRIIAAASAVVAGLACSLLHSVFDFVWYLPALIAITGLLMGCLFRLSQIASSGQPQRQLAISRPVWLALTAVVILICGGMVSNRIGPAQASGHWDQYLRLSLSQKAFDPNSAEQRADIERMISHLQAVVSYEPQNARAHLRLATMRMRRFNMLHELAKQQRGAGANDMTIYDLRDAALEGGFVQLAEQTLAEHDADRDGYLTVSEAGQDSLLSDQLSRGDLNADGRVSLAELRQVQLADWLVKAFGSHCRNLVPAYRHIQLALQASPSQGEAYLTLAKVYFLGDANAKNKGLFVRQAVKLRPHDPDVLLDAGHEAQHLFILARNEAQGLTLLARRQPAYQKLRDEKLARMRRFAKLAIDCWKPCFRQGPVYQRKITRLIGTNREVIATFLKDFQPSAAALKVMRSHYHQIGNRPLEQLISGRLAQQAASEAQEKLGIEAANLWLDAQRAFAQIEQHEAAGKCAENAVHQAPDDYKVHNVVGTYYLQQKVFDQAVTHLRWCAYRRPDDLHLQTILRQAVTGQIGQTSSSAARPDIIQPRH